MALVIKRNLCSFKSGHYDFIISGGGMIGSTLACVLSKNPMLKNKSILLIENSPKPKPAKPISERNYSNRVSAINPKSRKLFESCGMWKYIEENRFHTINDIKVWGEYSQLCTTFSLLPNEDLAYIIENDLIVESATKELEGISNITVSYSTKVEDVVLPNEDSKLPTVILHDGTKLECDLLIGADGAYSSIRNKMGFHYLSFDYKQFGIVATLNVGSDLPNNVAWQKFLRNGPIALLPLSDSKSSLVWSTSIDEAQTLLSMPDDSFVDAINTALNAPPKKDPIVISVQNFVQNVLNRLDCSANQKELMAPYISSIELNSRAKFPLSFGHASQYVVNRACLIGDAAHKVHPLAGQGVNLGFNDIQTLVEILSQGVRDGSPIGNISDLKHYESETLKHNVPIMAGINLFHNLFVTDMIPFKVLGNSSFLIANSFGPLKSAMRALASN